MERQHVVRFHRIPKGKSFGAMAASTLPCAAVLAPADRPNYSPKYNKIQKWRNLFLITKIVMRTYRNELQLIYLPRAKSVSVCAHVKNKLQI